MNRDITLAGQLVVHTAGAAIRDRDPLAAAIFGRVHRLTSIGDWAGALEILHRALHPDPPGMLEPVPPRSFAVQASTPTGVPIPNGHAETTRALPAVAHMLAIGSGPAKRPKTDAERSRAYRERKRRAAAVDELSA